MPLSRRLPCDVVNSTPADHERKGAALYQPSASHSFAMGTARTCVGPNQPLLGDRNVQPLGNAVFDRLNTVIETGINKEGVVVTPVSDVYHSSLRFGQP
jgi:hypothetical protein